MIYLITLSCSTVGVLLFYGIIKLEVVDYRFLCFHNGKLL